MSPNAAWPGWIHKTSTKKRGEREEYFCWLYSIAHAKNLRSLELYPKLLGSPLFWSCLSNKQFLNVRKWLILFLSLSIRAIHLLSACYKIIVVYLHSCAYQVETHLFTIRCKGSLMKILHAHLVSPYCFNYHEWNN